MSARRARPGRRMLAGCGAADLAMNVVLPEIDGRIVARADLLQGRGAAKRTPGVRAARPPAAPVANRVHRRPRARLGAACGACPPINASSPASFRTIRPRPAAPAMPWVSIRRRASPRSPRGSRLRVRSSSRSRIQTHSSASWRRRASAQALSIADYQDGICRASGAVARRRRLRLGPAGEGPAF